ncbi:hypothetical protein JIR23_10540 [Bradyrhizobium diazoefficiens]|nr:hypothetical protein [Bradyrhizobium diazoefficiens]QQN66083.1 hypothetical protein JIR23_10540 [Bradyrhizobium diazoefficiens]
MPSGDDDEIVARCEPLLVFGEDLAGVRLLVELLTAERFFDEVLTGAFLAGRTFLE